MGKSTVLRLFEELGAMTIDADEIVDGLLEERPVLDRVRRTLGEEVFRSDGSLDRARVAAIIFADKEIRETIEGILHPLVMEKIKDLLDGIGAHNGDSVVVVEVPLIFEKGYADRFHKNITVYADEETALSRLEKAGIGRHDAMIRLKAQMPIEEKIRMSDFTVDNNGTWEETKRQVREIYGRLLRG